MPAETIVAAWIMAETGVGPSMASGSQTCSGNWADLPTVPAKRSRPISAANESPRTPEGVAASVLSVSGLRRIWVKLNVPVAVNSATMPSSMKTSPIRVVMKALTIAFLADSLPNQKPISR